MVADMGKKIPALIETAKALQKARRVQQLCLLMSMRAGSAGRAMPAAVGGRLGRRPADDARDLGWRGTRLDE